MNKIETYIKAQIIKAASDRKTLDLKKLSSEIGISLDDLVSRLTLFVESGLLNTGGSTINGNTALDFSNLTAYARPIAQLEMGFDDEPEAPSMPPPDLDSVVTTIGKHNYYANVTKGDDGAFQLSISEKLGDHIDQVVYTECDFISRESALEALNQWLGRRFDDGYATLLQTEDGWKSMVANLQRSIELSDGGESRDVFNVNIAISDLDSLSGDMFATDTYDQADAAWMAFSEFVCERDSRLQALDDNDEYEGDSEVASEDLVQIRPGTYIEIKDYANKLNHQVFHSGGKAMATVYLPEWEHDRWMVIQVRNAKNGMGPCVVVLGHIISDIEGNIVVNSSKTQARASDSHYTATDKRAIIYLENDESARALANEIAATFGFIGEPEAVATIEGEDIMGPGDEPVDSIEDDPFLFDSDN